MKKLAVILALLMIASVPAYAGVEPVDGIIDTHTKSSSLTPVQDMGRLYGTIDTGIHDSLDKVPVIKERGVVIRPIEHMLTGIYDGAKTLVNGTWDLLTLKRMREHHEEKK